MTVSVEKLGTLVDEAREARNKHGKHIGYHRIEIERITKKMLRGRERAGEEMTVPEAVRNQPNDWEWREMFLI